MFRFAPRVLLSLLLFTPLLSVAQAGEGTRYLREVFHSLRAGQVAVFDLDDTLFQSNVRSFRALQSFLKEPSTRKDFPLVTRHIERTMELRHVDYFLKQSLAKIALSREEIAPFAKAFFPYWKARFFTNEGALLDPTVPGALGFVRLLHAKGVIIVYLTGRDEPRMGEGTRKALQRYGFPLGERAHLFLKPEAGTDDLSFKKAAFVKIRQFGEVHAFFDNEPKNVLAAAGSEGFPGATCFFLDTVNSGGMHALVGKENIHWVGSFRLPAE
jgi:hypothetical protein